MKKFSVRIAKQHATSISLEDEFYEELKKIARKQEKTLCALITEIDATRTEENLSSAIRIYVLREILSR